MIGGTRDFLLALGPAPGAAIEEPRSSVLRWHEALGGASSSWTSPELRCQVWGRRPAVSVVRDGGIQWRIACILTGAPVGFGSLDPTMLQEEVLHAYRHHGLGALARLDGSFCGVLLDERQGAYVFTDRFGFRKAFVVRAGGITYAASRAVVLARGLDLSPDPAGVACCTAIGHTLGRRTLFASCEAVMPATAVNIGTGAETRYWNISSLLGERRRDHRATEDLRTRFNAACSTLVAAQDTPASNVTGGFDTRAVLSAALLAGRPLVGVTSGFTERVAVDRVVSVSGIRHRYFALAESTPAGHDAAFALLTDGEWQATGGGALLDYWQRAAAAAPSGCLHGGIGEVWRSYHYKFLWPPASSIVRHPLDFLVTSLLRPRAHLLRLLAPALRGSLTDIVRHDANAVWETVSGAAGVLAAIDGFYLLERQRGLTRIASAADLWNPAYSPFAQSMFCETAFGYLGAQNRGETLHRAIVSGNSPALAAVERSDGGDCRPAGPWTTRGRVGAATARHLAGRAVGARVKSWLQRPPGRSTHPSDVSADAFDAAAFYDVDVLRRILSGASSPGDAAGNVAAIAYATTAPASAASDVLRHTARSEPDAIQELTVGPTRAPALPLLGER